MARRTHPRRNGRALLGLAVSLVVAPGLLSIAQAAPPGEGSRFGALPAPPPKAHGETPLPELERPKSEFHGLPAPASKPQAGPKTDFSQVPEPLTTATGDGDEDADDEPTASDEAAPASKKQSDELEKPKWIKHRVIGGDRLDEIADRYGVSRESIIRWNKLDKKRPMIRAGQKLRIYAKRYPPPREQISYKVRKGDTWGKVAKKYGVDEDRLRRWNPRVPRKWKAGAEIAIWIEPKPEIPEEEVAVAGGSSGKGGSKGKTRGGKPKTDADLPIKKVRQNGRSVGKPSSGSLSHGVQLPENEALYHVRRPENSYGSTHTIELVQLTIARWRRDHGYTGTLHIGDISKSGGGRLRPHASHRTGRDIDIRLPLKKGIKRSGGLPEGPNDVDWDATWALIKEMCDTGQVLYIFLGHGRQKYLYKAARRAGMSKAELERYIQYPQAPKTGKSLVRHAKGHNAHFHVRFKCGPTDTRCRDK